MPQARGRKGSSRGREGGERSRGEDGDSSERSAEGEQPQKINSEKRKKNTIHLELFVAPSAMFLESLT